MKQFILLLHFALLFSTRFMTHSLHTENVVWKFETFTWISWWIWPLKKLEDLVFSKTPIPPSVTYALRGTVTTVTTAGSTVTTQLINCVVNILLVVNTSDYSVTVQSPCNHCATYVTDEIEFLLCREPTLIIHHYFHCKKQKNVVNCVTGELYFTTDQTQDY